MFRATSMFHNAKNNLSDGYRSPSAVILHSGWWQTHRWLYEKYPTF
jgi:hypothetical protein